MIKTIEVHVYTCYFFDCKWNKQCKFIISILSPFSDVILVPVHVYNSINVTCKQK